METSKNDSILYFEDLVLEYFQNAQKQLNISSPDAYDDLWLNSFDKIKKAYKIADKSYLEDEELKKTLKNLNRILNDGSLSCRDLFQKSFNLIATVKKLGVSVVYGVDKTRFTDTTTAVLSLDSVDGEQFVCVDLCYDNDTSLPFCEVECLYQEPATNTNIKTAQTLLNKLAETYRIPIYNDLSMSLIKHPVKIEWVDLDEGLYGEYDPDNPDDIPLLRFDVSVYKNGEWETKEDGSYCTRFAANIDMETKQKGLYILMNRLYDVLADDVDASIKKLGEELSWISVNDVSFVNKPPLEKTIQLAKSQTISDALASNSFENSLSDNLQRTSL